MTTPEPLIDLDEAVARILEIHEASGGATFSLRWGSLAGRNLYAAATYPQRTVRIPGPSSSPRRLRSFIRANLDLLQDPRNCIGTWFSEEYNLTVLDVSVTVATLEEAIQLGRAYNQDAILDLQQMSSIDIERAHPCMRAAGHKPAVTSPPLGMRRRSGNRLSPLHRRGIPWASAMF